MSGITQAFLNPVSSREPLVSLLPEGHYLAQSEETNAQWAVHFNNAMNCGELIFNIDGSKVHTGDVILNTALLIGNDALKLMAIIDGQCEINAFVRGKNRTWMADIIENDRSGVFHAGNGWEDVISLLRESDEGAVFMSYTVTDSIDAKVFDDWFHSTIEERGLDADSWEVTDALQDEWLELGVDKRWELCEAWADERAAQGYEISPERWAEPDAHFGSGWNASMVVDVLEKKKKAFAEQEDMLV